METTRNGSPTMTTSSDSSQGMGFVTKGKGVHPFAMNAERQDAQGQQEQSAMKDNLATRAHIRSRRMRVAVAGEQDTLKEHHAGIPDRRRPAQQREHHFGDHRLNNEQQAVADEHRQRQRAWARRASSGDSTDSLDGGAVSPCCRSRNAASHAGLPSLADQR